jgi:hypothetical protein
MTIMIGSAGTSAASQKTTEGSIIAGALAMNLGFSKPIPLLPNGFGSISPDPSFVTGFEIQAIANGDFIDVFFFGLLPTSIPDSDAVWIDLKLTGTFRGGGFRTITYVRSAMAYFADASGTTRWTIGIIPSDDIMVDTNTYEFIFT